MFALKAAAATEEGELYQRSKGKHQKKKHIRYKEVRLQKSAIQKH